MQIHMHTHTHPHIIIHIYPSMHSLNHFTYTYSFRYANVAVGDHCHFQATVEDYRAFIAFHILMAINHLPSIDDYWKKDEFLHYLPIAKRISRDRFRELSR